MLTTNKGKTVRTRVAEIRSTGRNTMGVKLIDLPGNEKLQDIARVVSQPEEEDVPREPLRRNEMAGEPPGGSPRRRVKSDLAAGNHLMVVKRMVVWIFCPAKPVLNRSPQMANTLDKRASPAGRFRRRNLARFTLPVLPALVGLCAAELSWPAASGSAFGKSGGSGRSASPVNSFPAPARRQPAAAGRPITGGRSKALIVKITMAR